MPERVEAEDAVGSEAEDPVNLESQPRKIKMVMKQVDMLSFVFGAKRV